MTLSCDSIECAQALKRLQTARNKILNLCGQLAQLRASAASFNMLMLTMLGISAALVTASQIPIIGLFLAAALLIAAALAFLAAVYFATRSALINGQISNLEDELAAARNDFDNAVSEVMANCPQECWGVLDQPTC
jgi:hypothetical protein